tara:strand:- start:236 stop:706 length:471 start_codon:yes stop_codon:yes gene_type:complete
MNIILEILGNKIFASACFGSLFGTIFKFLFRKLNVNHGNTVAYGGMPSGHTSFCIAGSWSVGLKLGFDSPVFGVAMIWATLVIFDALGIRRKTGEHAKAINSLMGDLFERKDAKIIKKDFEELQEILGHTPVEVTAGIAIGIATAFLVNEFWPFWI